MDNIDIPADDELNNYDELFVPNIASADPEERKLARGIRIQKRVEALQRNKLQEEQKQKLATTDEKQPAAEKTLLQIQLEKSNEILHQLINESVEYVTNIRVANDTREVDRRELEGIGRAKIFEQLNEEAKLAKEMFDEISAKWPIVQKYNDPLHIQDAIMEQKKKCDELIQQKDAIIDMLKMEVRLAEAKYYKDMQTQNDDINNLAKRVEKQVIIMRNAHAHELQAIEDVMIQERTNMMENNDKRWTELYKKREEQELAISKNKFKQKDEFEAVTTLVRVQHMERVRDVKIRLERDHEVLQQEFETIKATALANSEKMDYNFQILKKREDENLIIKSNQKRKLNKLQDVINVLRKRIASYESETADEIQRVYGEIRTLQRYIADVRRKSQSMAKMNETKYMEVWELNRRQAAGVFTKLLNIDRLINEQQLGMDWEEPHMKLLVKEKLPSYVEAVKVIEAATKDRLSAIKKETTDFGALDSTDMNLAYRRILNNVLERISDKSSFLIENRLNKILADVDPKEVCLLRVDNVFSALGISKILEINILLHFFRPYVRCQICSDAKESQLTHNISSNTSQPSTLQTHDESETNEEIRNEFAAIRESDHIVDDIVSSVVDPTRLETSPDDDLRADDVVVDDKGECAGPRGTKKTAEYEKKIVQVIDYTNAQDGIMYCLNNHPLFMHPGSVLKALREFVTNVFCKSDDSNIGKIANTTLTISRMLEERDVIDYWERFKLIIGKHRIEVWDAVMYGLQKYHSILLDRNEVYEELKCLRRTNMELNHLLKKYRMQNKNNDVNNFDDVDAAVGDADADADADDADDVDDDAAAAAVDDDDDDDDGGVLPPPCAKHREMPIECNVRKTGPQCRLAGASIKLSYDS